MSDDNETSPDLISDPETIKEISKKLFSILYTRDEAIILSEYYKDDYQNIDLTCCTDPNHNDNTLLIAMASLNLTKIATHFIIFLKNIIKSKNDYISYLNRKNSKGYNAILYSAFRGNLEILKKLVENGANCKISNERGLNALHLAAQGNFPHMIVYLMEKNNFDINTQDNSGNTALHWAVYMNSKQTIDYLIYYNINIDIKDKDGETALSIAKNKGNVAIIKKLEDDAEIIFNTNSEKNDIKKNKKLYYYSFIITMVIIEGMNQSIIVNGYQNMYMCLVFSFLFIMQMFFFFTTSKSDPGKVLNITINSLILLVEQGENLKSICPWCVNYVGPHTTHCSLCNKCIDYQEFHDKYVNNCIGKKNFGLYINFLYFITFVFVFKFLISFWGLFWIKSEFKKGVIGYLVLEVILAGSISVLLGRRIYNKIRLFNRYNFNKFYEKDAGEILNGLGVGESNNSSSNSNNSLNSLDKKNLNLSMP